MCWSLTMELSSIESRLITVTWKKTVVGLPAIEKNRINKMCRTEQIQ
jgi:hypothetical protein